MLRDELRHLEHRDLRLPAEDRLQRIVGIDLRLHLLVLEAVLLDVIPNLLDYLSARKRLVPNYFSERCEYSFELYPSVRRC